MKQYMILKQFTLSSKTYTKDRMFSGESLSEATINRLIKGGYIKAITAMDVEHEEPAHYQAAEDLLTPTEVNKLKLPNLIKYANQIGVESFDPKIKVAELRKLVNDFIVENSKDDEDEDDEDEEFLTPDEVAKLSRQELSEYANEIGVSFADDITDTDLVILVNEFIAQALQEDDNNA